MRGGPCDRVGGTGEVLEFPQGDFTHPSPITTGSPQCNVVDMAQCVPDHPRTKPQYF